MTESNSTSNQSQASSEQTISLTEYYDKLAAHDWFYDYSDDHSVWKRGRAAQGALESQYKDKPEFKALFDAFRDHHFSGSAFNTEKKPYPEKPKENVMRTGESNNG